MNPRLLKRLEHLAWALSDQLEKGKLWLLCCFSILYLVVTCLFASRKLMWNDELYTFYIAQLPTMSDVWSALLTGVEVLPPFFYVATRTSFALFGVNHLSIRLPEVLGFWVMSLCLFQFVSKRSSALHGLVAMLFPLVTGAYYYASEARPYGLVLGCGGLALLAWQSAAEGYSRKLALLGLTGSLAVATSSHYYAVLLLFPLAMGELVRSRGRRRLDLPIWLAFGLAMAPLLLFLPLIERGKTYTRHFWAPLHWGGIPDSYSSLLAPAVVPLVAMLIVAAVYVKAHPFDPSRRQQAYRPLPPSHELAAALGFVALPAVAVILAKLLTGVFTDRYALPAVLGFSILLAFATYRSTDGRALIGATLVLSLCGWFVLMEARNYRREVSTSMGQAETCKFLQSVGESSLPIVASNAHTFMALTHYAPCDLALHLVYLADPEASLRYLGHNTIDRGMLDLMKPWFHLNVEEYSPYVATQQRFLVYGDLWPYSWLLSELTAAGMRIEVRGRHGNDLLLLVSPIEQSDASSSYRRATTAGPFNSEAGDSAHRLSQ